MSATDQPEVLDLDHPNHRRMRVPTLGNGRFHVLVHKPPAGLGGTGLAHADDDRDAAITRAREVLSGVRPRRTERERTPP